MSVMYKLTKVQRTYTDGRQDPANGKWYAKAIYFGTVDIDGLSEIIQRNCTVKKSDVKAVLTELVEVMADKLQDSYAVKLNGLGTFKIGLRSKGAVEPGEFTSANIVGSHVNFLAEGKVDSSNGMLTRALCRGVKFSQMQMEE